MKKIARVISLDIDLLKKQELVDLLTTKASRRQSSYLCVANVHMVIEAYTDKTFANCVNSADWTIADGVPLVWYNSKINHVMQERIAGMDLLPELLKVAQENDQSVFFYGGTTDMLEKTQEYLTMTYPVLKVAGMYSPAFSPTQTNKEDLEIIENINRSAANWVVVILGCPKQERWMYKMKGKINSVMVGIGGSLPVMINMQSRAPKWMQRNGLEWAYRLYQEPKRLFKRYATTNSWFLFLFLKDMLFKPNR